MVNIKINDIDLAVEENTTILQAARKLNINIPTLCHLSLHVANEKNHNSSCRICIVEVAGRRNLVPACSTYCQEGMDIKTHSLRVINARRTILELLLSDHPLECVTCDKNGVCILQNLAQKYGITDNPYKGELSKDNVEEGSIIKRNNAKCILCGACETVCTKVQTVSILGHRGRGFKTTIGPAFELSLENTPCTFCGQCVSVCPTGALTQSSSIGKVWKLLSDKTKHVVVQVAPAVRVALGELFDRPLGEVVTGKMVASLRRIGFEKVFDTDFAADVTVLEESHELLERLKEKKNLPILTSCCPGWINFIEHQFPDLVSIPSSCKSPHEMFGSLVKSYYAEKMGWNPKDIVVVSIMPCLAKKYEANRKELSQDGLKDVDYVLTTRELGKMIKEAGLNFNDLPDEDFDSPLGESSGAGVIFGASGGVIEAALRQIQYDLTGEVKNIEFTNLHSLDGVKISEVDIAGNHLRIACASGLGNARYLLELIKSNKDHFDAIEIMACPGGCVSGGGQPFHKRKLSKTIVKARRDGLHSEDRGKSIRISSLNQQVNTLYKEYIGEIGGERAHKLLHTVFFSKEDE